MPRTTRPTTQLVALTTLRAWVAEQIGADVKVYGTAYEAVHIIAEQRSSLVQYIPQLTEQFGIDVIALANRPWSLVFLNYDPATMPDRWPQKRTNIRELFRSDEE